MICASTKEVLLHRDANEDCPSSGDNGRVACHELPHNTLHA